MPRRSSGGATSCSGRSIADRSPAAASIRLGAKHMTETLAEKTCTPCRGGAPPLGRDEALRLQPVFLVGACTYLVLPVDLFVAQLVACAASFYAHVFFDKEYHIEGSRLQQFP